MRVAFVVPETTHRRDSRVGQRMDRLAWRLVDRGHDVVVLCRQWWDGDHPEFEQDGVSYRRVVDSSGGDGGFATRLPLAITGVDPDVVHVAFTSSRIVLAARLGATLARAPLVVDWYGTEGPIVGDGPTVAARRRAIRGAATAPEFVVTPSETVRTGVRELGAADDDVVVISDPIDIEGIEDAPAVHVADVVYSRRLDDDANLESLLLALAELRDRDWSAAIVGDGPRRAYYERQAKDLRIDDRVTFAGEQPVEKRIQAFKGAHVFVQTSYREAFPTDLLRALACGCVGVVEYHANSSAHELVEGRERGFRTTSEQELTDALRTAADLPREELDESFAIYDESAFLARYLDVYENARNRVSIRPLLTAGAVVLLVALLVVALMILL